MAGADSRRVTAMPLEVRVQKLADRADVAGSGGLKAAASELDVAIGHAVIVSLRGSWPTEIAAPWCSLNRSFGARLRFGDPAAVASAGSSLA
jgi:hypothetical protein